MTKIQHEEHGKNGSFYIDRDGEWVAELTYIRSAEGQMTIDHTEVDEELREEGTGGELVAEAVKFARANDLQIKATCPFAKKVLSENPDFHDVFLN